MAAKITGRMTVHGLILGFLLVLFSWLFIDLSWTLHEGMRTHKADLGQVAQAVWQSGQGRFVAMTDNGPLSSRLTDHVEPILAIISPILWLWRDVKALLALQVLAATVGGWLLYRLAQEHFRTLLSPQDQTYIWRLEPLRSLTNPVALAIVAAFLLSPQIQNALLTEFHAAPLAVPLILWAFYAVEKIATTDSQSNAGYWIQFIVATILTALVKEEMALLAAGLAIWPIYRLTISNLRLAIHRRLPAQSRPSTTDDQQPTAAHHSPTPTLLISLVLALLCVIWFYLATFVIVPAHAVEVYDNAENPYWARYGALGNSPLDIVKSLFTQPGLVFQILSEPVRANYLWTLAATFGFLCLLAPEVIVLSLPLLLANVLSEYPPQYYGEFHYSAPLVAYFGVSAVYGVGRLGKLLMRVTQGASPSFQQMPAAQSWVMAAVAMVRNSSTAIRPLVFGGLALWIAGWGLSGYLSEGRGPLGGRYDPVEVNDHHRLLDRFVAQVPWDAAVTATAAVHPHVALRERVYQFPIGMPEFGEAGDADWALLDVTTNTDMAPGDLHARVMQMLSTDWGVIDGEDGFLLLQQGATEKQIPEAFYDFVRVQDDDAESTESTEAESANGAIQLEHVAAEDWPRWRSTKIVTMWRVGDAFDSEQFAPKLVIYEPSGMPLYSYSDGTPTALIWYPPSQWQPGDRIQITTPALTLPRHWGAAVNANAAPAMSIPISDGNMTLVAAYLRNEEGELIAFPLPDDLVNNPFEAIASTASKIQNASPMITQFQTGDSSEGAEIINITSLSPYWASPSAGTVNLLMQWQSESLASGPTQQAWMESWVPFVHLRTNDDSTGNLSQQDGPPRWFLPYDADPWLAADLSLWDWRQLTLPPGDGMTPTELNLVVGLYNPENGERATIVDEAGNSLGNEAVVGQLWDAGQQTPDFACAMNGAACAAQP